MGLPGLQHQSIFFCFLPIIIDQFTLIKKIVRENGISMFLYLDYINFLITFIYI